MAGMDPMRFLESIDPVETMVMLAIANSWHKRKEELDKQLATAIVNQLAKSMKN